MGKEQEFKFQLDWLQYERIKRELAPHWVGQKLYWNMYYDTAHNDLRQSGEALRMTIHSRLQGIASLYSPKFTYKGPKIEGSDGLVVCEEIEFYPEVDELEMTPTNFFRDYSILNSVEQAGEAYKRAVEETNELNFLLEGGVQIIRDMYFHKAVFFELDRISFERDDYQYELEVETLAPELALEIVQEVADKALGMSSAESVKLIPSEKGKQQKLYDYLERNGKRQKIFEW